MKRHIDWFNVWVYGSLGALWLCGIALVLCLIAVLADVVSMVITGTPLVGEWIVMECVICR